MYRYLVYEITALGQRLAVIHDDMKVEKPGAEEMTPEGQSRV